MANGGLLANQREVKKSLESTDDSMTLTAAKKQTDMVITILGVGLVIWMFTQITK
jgi:hypothetical protein